ncbi:nuclear localization sequence-binding protein-like [Nicotiana tomentosiformis]|uniref:nuclear localization sequence-binding protein-like n=1 Tax=Nicotiana tomentosiformis TaxID=4098 RepID=UPI00388C9336
MTKSSQTPSKAKPSSKPGAKPKIIKSKPKKSVKLASDSEPTLVASPPMPSTVPALSSSVVVMPIISTSTVPLSPKPTSHAHVFISQITSKPTKVKATSRKSVKSGKVLDPATAKEEPKVKAAPAMWESALVKDDQETIDDLPVVEGESEKEIGDKESSNGSSYSWTDDEDNEKVLEEGKEEENKEEQLLQEKSQSSDEKKSENKGESGEEK